MNHFQRLFLACSTFLAGTALFSAEKPNILFISIDDLRPELGCYGVDGIHSPNIDALAEDGVLFDRAYCQVGVCNPSRASLLTGLRPDSARVWTLDVRFRHTVPDVVTLPQHFKQHGYYTASFGKIFHNPWPDNISWSEPHAWPKAKLWSDEAKQKLADFQKTMRDAGKPERSITRLRASATEIVDIPDSEHIDGAIAQQALAAMRRLAKQDKPFFLAAGFVRPHLPFVVPRKYWELYKRDEIQLVQNPSLPKDSPSFAMNTMYELRDYYDFLETTDPREGPLTEAQQRELKHGYYASVSFIDAQVGLLMAELKSLGLTQNTIVVLWSDHGWKLGEHGSWCKQSNYEIDARVPLIIRDPIHGKNNRTTNALVELVDLYPTLCNLSGIPLAEHVEGISLRPLLEDSAPSVKEAAFSQFPRRDDRRELMGYSMKTNQFRYVEWIDRRTKKAIAHELYDHENDPNEGTNIAGQASQKGNLERLSDQLWATLPEPPVFQPKEKNTAQSAGKPERPSLVLNNNRKETLIVFWVPEKGDRKEVGHIEPGESLQQNTTMGHRFLIEGTKSGLKKEITISRQNQTVNFSLKKAATSEKPNVVFIMGDDWSWPHAGILGDPVVKTPAFDRIAREGILFENAFVSSPSCTPSRFSIVSGQYHWRLESGANLGGSLRADVPVYPDLLAEAGYLTGFCRKGASPSKHEFRGSDPFGKRFKNFADFFTNRKGEAPFCFWYGAGEPHRPYNWEASKDSDLDLSKIQVPAYLPDNETTRTDLGDYYLKVEQLDHFAMEILDTLEKAGELENTIVVMSGDNGMPFPRAKATLYDSGTRVPLAIRWGKKVKSGRTISDFVSLTDLAPTFLEAVGLPVPEAMTGRSLLPILTSDKSDFRKSVLTGMEQHVYPNPSRAIRTRDFLYIRNFSPASWKTGKQTGEPVHFDFKKTPWPTVEGAFSHNIDPGPTKQWMRKNATTGEHAELYRLAFDQRPDEELYDLKKDPDQLKNVAEEKGYRETRDTLSEQLATELRASADPRFSVE